MVVLIVRLRTIRNNAQTYYNSCYDLLCQIRDKTNRFFIDVIKVQDITVKHDITTGNLVQLYKEFHDKVGSILDLLQQIKNCSASANKANRQPNIAEIERNNKALYKHRKSNKNK